MTPTISWTRGRRTAAGFTSPRTVAMSARLISIASAVMAARRCRSVVTFILMNISPRRRMTEIPSHLWAMESAARNGGAKATVTSMRAKSGCCVWAPIQPTNKSATAALRKYGPCGARMTRPFITSQIAAARKMFGPKISTARAGKSHNSKMDACCGRASHMTDERLFVNATLRFGKLMRPAGAPALSTSIGAAPQPGLL